MTINEILQETKKLFIRKSMDQSITRNEDMNKAIQAIGLVNMYIESNMDEKYVVRDTRNFIYELQKNIKDKNAKKIFKELLKIVK